MPKQSHPDFLIKLILRARALETETDGRDRGYIMLVTSVLSIMMFSMLAAYLVLTDMSKTATSAFVDSTNTFMVAETGLNTRANLVRDKFANYNRPSGRAPKYIDGVNLLSLTSRPTNAQVIEAMKSCIYAVPGTDTATTYRRGTDDLACAGNSGWTNNADGSRSYNAGSISTSDAKYNSSSRWQDVQNGYGESRTNLSKYTAYSFVVDKTNYTGTNNAPPIETLSSGEYAGLKAQTYTYSVYASAIDNQAAVDTTNINTLLQMDFRSRVIPLFQFAAFYEGDLEVSSSSNMTLGGWVHTNGNFYAQPYANSPTSTTLTSKLTAAGLIYNRIDALPCPTCTGITRMLKTGTTSTYLEFPSYTSTDATPPRALDSTEITALENAKDGTAGAQSLYSPPAGFLRKRSYYNSRTGATSAQRAMAVGDYWASADMRLELVPNRGGINTTPNEAIIPFSFTAIQQGGTTATTCSTTAPAAETDPAANYISPDRAGAANMQCNQFTKGQLQSLRQPVMVLTAVNQPDTSIVHTDTTAIGSESKTLGRPATLPTPPTLSATANTDATKLKILRALQVAMASTPSPIAYDRLGTALNNGVYNLGDHLQTFRVEFRRLLDTIPTAELPTADVTTLMTFSPNQIAALRNAWFLPAPIQRVSTTTTNNPTTAGNPSNSGFYDGRERRWMTMLQTNIKSLSVWNRDGLYVNAADETMTTAYSTDNTRKNAAFNSGTGANFTDGLAFTRAAAVTTAPLGSMRRLGLGSTDITEGGLVFHATVNDDLNGNGTISATAETTPDTTRSVYKRKPDNTIALDRDGNQIVMDYPRKYQGVINTTSDTNKAPVMDGYYGESPYGFAFNDGDYLPGALTLVTDQSIYIQGNFNNHNNARTDNTTPAIPNDTTYTPSPQRLPAAIMGDTITLLSNKCVSSNSTRNRINHLGVPAGQLNCGLPNANKGSVDIAGVTGTGSSNAAYYITANSNVGVLTNTTEPSATDARPTYYNTNTPMAVNAAFLSYTGISYGNAGTNRGYGAAADDLRITGGINNYMRMLEDWGGSTGQHLHYYGSFVSLGIPLENSGKYRAGSRYNSSSAVADGTYYSIPQRNFNFDTNFDNVDGLPPMTPRGIYLEQQVFRRSRNY